MRNLVRDNFAVINADDFYGKDAFVQLSNHLKNVKIENGFAHYCMVGYRLTNTLTENGTVSRGQCTVDHNGMLLDVTERTKIKKTAKGAAYLEEDGGTWIDLPQDTIVSMNCWGFTPDVFAGIEKGLCSFLSEDIRNNPLKAEYYLPAAIDRQNKEKKCDVRVYPTAAVWHGVTYAEDKETVKQSIDRLVKSGEYPEKLWN